MSFSLTLPYPPSVNGMYRNAGAGDNVRHRIKTKRYQAWLSEAQFSICQQGLPDKIHGAIRLSISVERKHKTADIDNLIKPIQDFLVSADLIDDDKHVESLSIAWALVEGAVVYVEAA